MCVKEKERGSKGERGRGRRSLEREREYRNRE